MSSTLVGRGKRLAVVAHRRGVTFIELIGVLVVAIIIIAGALALYSEANTSSRTNQLVVALGALTGSVRALHANTGAYGDGVDYNNLIDVLVNANAVPPGMLITGTALNYRIDHAFGGQIHIWGASQEFVILANELDGDICIRIATESTAKSSSGLQRVGIFEAITETNQGSVLAVPAGQFADFAPVGGTFSLAPASPALTNAIFRYGAGTSVASDSASLPISPGAANVACSTGANVNAIAWLYQ